VCNALNHWDGCTCGFGGEGHLGGGHGGGTGTAVLPAAPAPREKAWARWATGHARSDLGEPLTHPTVCPVCGAEIFFHTNGNGDVVFFDDLGWPWPKHACLTQEEGIRVASRSAEVRRVATLFVRPSFIPLPPGLSPAEFDAACVDSVTYGVIVRMKEVTLWWAKGDSVIRQRLEALALALFTGTKRALRVYVPRRTKVKVGEVVRLTCTVRDVNGRSVLWASVVHVVEPGATEPEL
jgi:hypothetical protein